MKNVTMVAIALLALSGCSKKGGGRSAEEANMAKLITLKSEMCACKDTKCAQDVSEKLTKLAQARGQGGPNTPPPTEEDTRKAAAIGAEIGACMQAAMSASATPSAPPESAAAGSAEAAGSAQAAGSAADSTGLPPECAEYRARVEKLKTCDALPEKAREALVKAYDDASAGWATMPEGAKAGLGTSCERGTEALVAAAKEACGW